MTTPSEGTPPGASRPSAATQPMFADLATKLQAALGEGYAVETQLGAGGFAVVFLVRDLNLKRKLAVKVLSPDLISSKTVMERFRREAETVAQLSHPHIVPLHFIGQKDDMLYLAMECVDGGSLADRIQREHRLPHDDVIRYMREVAMALDHAHRRGVIHRDIKPHNVLLDRDTGRALVTDFGIARTAEGTSLTASGMMVGTPAYLSPEQVTGNPTDHRADIYALGVMGFEMLTGEPPFTGPTPTAVLMKRLAEAPPRVGKLRPDTPQILQDVIEGCLAHNPDERYQSAGDVARTLGAQTPISGGHVTSQVTVKRRARSRRRLIMAVAGAAVVIAVAIAAWQMFQSGVRRRAADSGRIPAGMVVVPAGTYTIGVNGGRPWDGPAHQVTLDSFAIDRTEVTVGAYRRYVEATGTPAPWPAGAMPDSMLPVTGVLWSEANGYCAWRNRGGRLPTEQEWEAAARGIEGRRFPWGNEMLNGAANIGREDGAILPVGSFPLGATPQGVRDLIGNVWEWTSSSAAAYPGGSAPPGADRLLAIRGGAFDLPVGVASASFRGGMPPSAQRLDLVRTGFRCVVGAAAIAATP
ncbi:MAG TPA: bifunctional serine/threonine-protein kinase/formylglycine-generating enzyme family protein [Gemmatimonadales bacterium]|nr:bifunctional serine/threonine-protein kinase/formylglycine-generating enzyme family protein [Gemmatimonadales bacterium]